MSWPPIALVIALGLVVLDELLDRLAQVVWSVDLNWIAIRH
jgi:hypothetical protein